MTRRFRVLSVFFFAATCFGLYVLVAGTALFGGEPSLRLSAGDALYGLVLLWSLFLGLRFFFAAPPDLSRFRRRSIARALQSAEVFLAAVLLFAVFEYIFASNANMDYVQRFIASGGNLNLAPDTATERQLVALRFGPLLFAGLCTYITLRVLAHSAVSRAVSTRGLRHRAANPVAGLEDESMVGTVGRVWGLPLVILSAFLHAMSFPSFVSIDGYGWLGWFALVPVFIVLRVNRYRRGVFYAAVFGAFTMVFSNYWLGTFNLVSLQLTIVFFVLFYVIFGAIIILPMRRMGRFGFLYLAAGWTAFEYTRSIGFLGYPWVLAGHSQYAVVPLIQVAGIGGVWAVSALVLLVNGALAAAIVDPPAVGARSERGARGARGRVAPALAVGVLVAITWIAGALSIRAESAAGEPRTARIALIQQNSDPRKHDYERTFQSLVALTEAALSESPDLVAWSETAFVPNIRRWSREDPRRYRLARLVLRFLDFQKSIGTWLLTGNDDYRQVFDDAGEEVDRLNFNAAVLFSPSGERVETYHKVKLVPFTEHFPYRRRLPWVYDLLQNFDINFWEPGTERLVFHHPDVRFATPICFEDVFPNHVRLFVREGLDVILALTNDYWSLSPVQAKQHFVASLYRSVENRRPMARSTASGLTGHVDAYGRIVDTLPYFEEGYMVAEVRTDRSTTTPYTRFGDWLPITLLVVVPTIGLVTLLRRRR